MTALTIPELDLSTNPQNPSFKHGFLTEPAILQKAPPAGWERFEVERDGTTIDAWLLKPADFDPGKQYPVVLDVHGGPHGFHGYAFNHMQQTLASHGFLVVFSNPRGLAMR